MWSPPPADERRALLTEHAERFPVPTRIPVLDDGGAVVELPFLLGNPSGAQPQAGDGAPRRRISPAFSHLIGAVNLGRRDEGNDDELVRDCVLWPEPRKVVAARNRWPGLVKALSTDIARKIGIVAPGEVGADDEMPIEIAAALEIHPRAVVRRFEVPGPDGRTRALHLVIEPPDRLRYEAITEALPAPDAQRERLIREYAEGIVVATDRGRPAAVFDCWPGLMLVACSVATRLAGAVESSRLGEW